MPAESINIKQYDILFKILDTARKIAYAKQRGVEHLVNFELRSFDNNREVGYDVDIDTIYLMFESHSLFETKMTKSGKELAKTLGLKEITETTWTIHSY